MYALHLRLPSNTKMSQHCHLLCTGESEELLHLSRIKASVSDMINVVNYLMLLCILSHGCYGRNHPTKNSWETLIQVVKIKAVTAVSWITHLISSNKGLSGEANYPYNGVDSLVTPTRQQATRPR
ncbi:hypothetical protein RJ639_009514 [Escallonia herrerae]|uniref:Uncharacterized protein n=1 Tax=Escallonia herrerae TaxID=1293975 RepID=A0AA88VRC4_9ASTE|nr:hypothetical protein RJ639_009514 [Escallonia herrerae]